MKPGDKPSAFKSIAINRKARFHYDISDRFEAGISLLGSEVKSLREGKVDFRDSYAAFENHELFLLELHIAEYPFANRFNHPPSRPRKLLMHRREIDRLEAKVQQQGYTLVPTRLYFKNGKVKVEIGLARGKRQYDKRDTIKKRDLGRLDERGEHS
ncbi:MAG: SsrA-binding protein SmpB [Bradymonadales bacterium]|nr:SsrA-binding protein SmpB [Bradymonadales bacterium]